MKRTCGLNRRIAWIGAMCAALCACTTTTAGKSQTTTRVDALLDAFVKDLVALDLPPLQLSLVSNLDVKASAGELARQHRLLADYAQELAQADQPELDVCRRIDVSIAASGAKYGAQRALLALNLLQADEDVSSVSRLSDLASGEAWYQYLLNRWNGADIDVDELFAFGEAQLARSLSRYDAVQVQLGFADNDEGLARHLESYQARLDGGEPTLALFERRQAQVWHRLPALFTLPPNVTPALIARSDRGESFPVPGYYDPNAGGGTFFYNLVADGYAARQADWLFLHEGTPGHHFQFSAAASNSYCASRLPAIMQPAFAEGWAAYVETLGKPLGLYATPEAQLAAIEWDMVRSARVVLDVGLNAYGWSEAQALTYWGEHVRGQDQIAQREIDRMLRWPAQVVTYKYGASVFEEVRKRFATDGDDQSVRRFHDVTLAFGPMPLATYQVLFPEMLGAMAPAN